MNRSSFFFFLGAEDTSSHRCKRIRFFSCVHYPNKYPVGPTTVGLSQFYQHSLLRVIETYTVPHVCGGDIKQGDSQKERMKIVLMGGPGCGQGHPKPRPSKSGTTCATSRRETFSARPSPRRRPVGCRAKSAIDRGQLVADDIVMDVLKEGMEKPDCKNGYILTGFPRTLNQAEKLDALGEKITKVYGFTVPDEVLIARTSGRWIHKASGRIYHEKFCPSKSKRRG